MEEKLSNVITEYEKVTGKSADPNVALNSTATIDSESSTRKMLSFQSLESPIAFITEYKIIFYVILGVFTVLLYTKPNFCYVLNKKDEKLVFSWMRVFVFTAIISMVILLGYYFYKSKYLKAPSE
jgi:hypothetical protein